MCEYEKDFDIIFKHLISDILTEYLRPLTQC